MWECGFPLPIIIKLLWNLQINQYKVSSRLLHLGESHCSYLTLLSLFALPYSGKSWFAFSFDTLILPLRFKKLVSFKNSSFDRHTNLNYVVQSTFPCCWIMNVYVFLKLFMVFQTEVRWQTTKSWSALARSTKQKPFSQRSVPLQIHTALCCCLIFIFSHRAHSLALSERWENGSMADTQGRF